MNETMNRLNEALGERYAIEGELGKGGMALLVRKNGAWLMVMEYQKHPAPAEDWQAAN